MDLRALQSVNPLDEGLSAAWPGPSGEADFVSLLSRAAEVGAGDADKDAGRDAAEKLVASALIVPLLQEVREQPLDADLFDGGMAEDAFRQRLDQLLADRIVRSTHFPLVDRVYETVTRAATMRGGRGGEVDARG